MNYIIVDFEFNQAYDFKNNKKIHSNPECPFEIIQIGAVKLDENHIEQDTFNILIKPTLYKKLNPHVSKLTGITDVMLNSNDIDYFDIGLKKFLDFCGNDRVVFCVWGKNDITSLFRNAIYHNINISTIPIEYINLQDFTSRKLKHFSGTHIGLQNAINSLNIHLDLEYHDALNDALYTAKIFKLYKDIRIPIAKYSNKGKKQKLNVKYSIKNKN